MAIPQKRSFQTLGRTNSILACLMILGLVLLTQGCGDEEGETVVINLEPWSLGFDSTNQFYLVERTFYLSVLKFTNSGTQYDLTALILAPATGGFSPWGLDIASGSPTKFLFITDVSTANDHPRLLAVNSTSFNGEIGLDNILLDETSGPDAGGGNPFTALRGVASLSVGTDVYRVFVADGSRVLIFEYDNNAKANKFSYVGEVDPTPACPAFDEPYGLAVDPETGSEALYVIDRGRESLYRFSGIGVGGTVTCNAEMDEWPTGASPRSFDDPEGVTFGETDVGGVSTEIIVVADSGNNRAVAFIWNGGGFEWSELPDNFEPFEDAAPFDLAFDDNQDLWVTYPAASAIAGPKQAGTP